MRSQKFLSGLVTRMGTSPQKSYSQALLLSQEIAQHLQVKGRCSGRWHYAAYDKPICRWQYLILFYEDRITERKKCSFQIFCSQHRQLLIPYADQRNTIKYPIMDLHYPRAQGGKQRSSQAINDPVALIP